MAPSVQNAVVFSLLVLQGLFVALRPLPVTTDTNIGTFTELAVFGCHGISRGLSDKILYGSEKKDDSVLCLFLNLPDTIRMPVFTMNGTWIPTPAEKNAWTKLTSKLDARYLASAREAGRDNFNTLRITACVALVGLSLASSLSFVRLRSDDVAVDEFAKLFILIWFFVVLLMLAVSFTTFKGACISRELVALALVALVTLGFEICQPVAGKEVEMQHPADAFPTSPRAKAVPVGSGSPRASAAVPRPAAAGRFGAAAPQEPGYGTGSYGGPAARAQAVGSARARTSTPSAPRAR